MFPLYSKEEIAEDKSKRHTKIVPFLIGENKPTVIICPGGAYEFVSFNNEGVEFANELNRNGYNAFMLVYRTGKNARFPAPMEDLARAVSFAKHNQKKFGIDAEEFSLFGSSAGGHLCAYFGARYEDFEKDYIGQKYSLRPKSIALSYPVISLCKETHEVTCHTLLGLHCTEDERRDKSVELIASETYPPTFLWHCEGDRTVPISNSIRFDEKLSELGVKHCFNRYKHGGHGIGLGYGTTADGWIHDAIKFMQSC